MELVEKFIYRLHLVDLGIRLVAIHRGEREFRFFYFSWNCD